MAEGSILPPDYPLESTPPPGTTTEIAPGLHWVRMPLPFPPSHINLWLIEDGAGWTIVDTGLARDEIREAWERVFAGTLGGRPVTRVIVTHFHGDHLGLAHWLSERWGAEVWMTLGEWLMARSAHSEGAPEERELRTAFYRAHGGTPESMGGYVEPHLIYRRGVPRVPPAFRRIQAGVPIAIGGREWIPIIGRGHAPEHACLYCPALGVLIAGDIVLPRITPNISVWPIEPLGDPLGDYLTSLGGLEGLPADTLVLPAHGLPFFGLGQRIAAIRAHHRTCLARLEEALAMPLAAPDCFGFLFKREIGPHNAGLAMGESIAHLNRLEVEGRAVRGLDADGVLRFSRR